ncbi:MAG: polymer-forming cytoskeletal protein [Comamonas sp.]
MAVQNPFFGKRDNDTFSTRTSASGTSLGTGSSNSYGSTSSTSSTSMSSTSPRTSSSSSASDSGGSKLTVGPNIKLKGVEITDCDTLVVEGTVEATMNSRVIQIAEQGAFRGSAEIDIAEIHGEFDGNLTVRQKLVIFSTGKVSGTIRYGKIVIEEGGQLSGEIQVGVSSSTASSAFSSSTSTPSSTASTGLQLAEDTASSSSLAA